MPGPSVPERAPGHHFLALVLSYPPRLILDAVMSLAVFALERRIRRAFRHGPAGQDKPAGPGADSRG
jgi:hypothetical protein